jgi:hypothetical protein
MISRIIKKNSQFLTENIPLPQSIEQELPVNFLLQPN